jgi:phenylacetate-CoA ligase
MAVRRLQLLNSLLSAYAAYPLAERLQGRGIRPKVVALRAHYALEPRQRRAEARRRLAEVVAFAGDQVPYYRDLFRQIGFDPAKIGKDAKYLQDIPYLTKDIVREHGPRLLSRTLESCRHHRVKTGGSTGPSAFFFYDQEAADWSSAVTIYARERIGAPRRRPQMHLAARFTDHGPRLWFNRETLKAIAMNRSNFFFDRLDDAGLLQIWDAIRRQSPYLLHAHPSTIYALATFVERKGVPRDRPAPFRVFESSGEVLDRRQRAKIQHVFGCTIVNRYGLAEFGVVAYELAEPCDALEALDSEVWFENRRCEQADVPELVLTGFRNRLMPLIRYATGDLAEVTDHDGVWWLSKIVGRTHSLVPINGIPHPTHHVQDVLDHRIGDIDEFQIDLRTCPPTLRIVADKNSNPDEIARKIEAYWPGAFSVAFIRPDELVHVGHRAKFSHVIASRPAGLDGLGDARP